MALFIGINLCPFIVGRSVSTMISHLTSPFFLDDTSHCYHFVDVVEPKTTRQDATETMQRMDEETIHTKALSAPQCHAFLDSLSRKAANATFSGARNIYDVIYFDGQWDLLALRLYEVLPFVQTVFLFDPEVPATATKKSKQQPSVRDVLA